ncbi:MAG: hypothetical protein O2923_12750 [Verrucomicrobia bacterium]|nr:hypothetical protein [Verrucomicrobiota bacterium]MDA1088367.1 hypothetical protein [Verrucomicrobiota bacterium]
MAQSLSQILLHLVFSTKNRDPLIPADKEHHKKKTFKEEFTEFLVKYGVDYDERYVWE